MKRWTIGLALLPTMGAAYVIPACDDSANAPVDGGSPDVNLPDRGNPDTGAPDSGSELPSAKAILVNGSPDGALALRFCFALGGQMQPLAAQPDRASGGAPYPGIFPGTGGPLPEDEGTDLAAFDVTLYAIVAESIRSETSDGGTGAEGQKSCLELIPSLREGRDYWILPSVPKGTLTRGTSWLLAVVGDRGSLALQRYSLDRSQGGDGIGLQFIHASSQAEALAPAGLYPAVITTLRPDAGSVLSLGGPVHFGQSTPGARRVADVDPASGAFVVLSDRPDAGGTSLGQPQPIPVAEAYTVGPGQPSYIENGKSYTMVYLGDPATSPPRSGPPGTAGHFLLFPN